jgi:hypothetical protein
MVMPGTVKDDAAALARDMMAEVSEDQVASPIRKLSQPMMDQSGRSGRD